MGRVKSFGVNYGVPNISYEYTVNAQTLEGSKFTPGVGAHLKVSGTSYPKSIYLNTDGSLKFPPGVTVAVFYDPQNPSDSALVQGFVFSTGAPIALSVIALLIFGFLHQNWVKAHGLATFSTVFFLAGLVVFLYGLSWINRYFNTQSFPSTTGKLLKAEVAFSTRENSAQGYTAEVEFEYQVQGSLYQSSQLKELPLWILKSRKQDVEPMVAKLRAEPELKIFYNPKAPWDGFLQHVSLLGASAPLLLSLPFMGVGLCFGLRSFHYWH